MGLTNFLRKKQMAETPTVVTPPKPTSCVELWLNKAFDQASVHAIRASIVKEAQDNPGKPIILYVDSYGGSVDSLLLLVDTLHEFPSVITACMGTAMSAGAVLLSCGYRRFVSPNARIMIHDVSSFSFGTVIDMDTTVREVKRMNVVLRKLLAKNCGRTVKEIDEVMNKNKDHFMTARQALKFGLVDQIGIPRVIQSTKYDLVIS